MWRRYFGPRFGAGILVVLSACSGEKFGEAPGQMSGGSAGKAAQTPRNTSDQGSFDHGIDGLPVTPQGGAADAGAGGSDFGGVPTAGSGGGHAGGLQLGGAAGDAGGNDAGGGDGACMQPIVEEWTDPLGEEERWYAEWGDPEVDIANRRLVVSWDDVAKRHQSFTGGYYATAQVTLNGYTPLAIYPYAKEGTWPTLRLLSNGTAIELGSTKYGTTEVWNATEWPDFSGVVITGSRSVAVTFYVKATEQAAAVKVRRGEQVWRTGWIKGFTWPDTDLNVFRYVGMNNSDVATIVDDDTIYVGRVSGCQGLTDVEVQTEFAN